MLKSLQSARGRPHVLDDQTIERIVRLCSRQSDAAFGGIRKFSLMQIPLAYHFHPCLGTPQMAAVFTAQ